VIGITGAFSPGQFGTVVALSCRPGDAVGMITWTQFGAYVSVIFTVFAGGVGLCWFAFWRQ